MKPPGQLQRVIQHAQPLEVSLVGQGRQMGNRQRIALLWRSSTPFSSLYS